MKFFLAALACTTLSCASIGAPTLRAQHPQFGQAIITSLNEQFLLNLVRLRYRDNPYFLEIANVTSQETVAGNASVGTDIGFGGPDFAGKNLAKAGIGGSYSRTPTVVFAPLQGEAFVRKMLTPITLPALLVLTQSGWSVGRVFDLVLDRLDDYANAHSATGPTPLLAPSFEKFHDVVITLRALQKLGVLQLGLEVVKGGHHQGEQRLLVAVRLPEGASPPAELIQLREQLRMNPDESEVGFVDDQVRVDCEERSLRLRSMLGMMFYLSHGIEVPTAHREAGFVTQTKDAHGAAFDWLKLTGHLFQVKSSEREPSDAYVKVFYRGHWFFVPDSDLETKSTFMLLTQLFSLQAGSVQVAAPTLTLPVR